MKAKTRLFKVPASVFLVAGIFLFFSSLVANEINVSKPAAWVNQYDYKPQSINEDPGGGYAFLRIENQVNLIEKSFYVRHTINLLSMSGVQTFSTISANFDPSYQDLKFHHVNIIRNGQTIDKLKDADIETIQRESQMERYLYDGSLTTFINLKDVRENDVIDYAYSITGENPISRGNYGATFYLNFQTPVNNLFYRVITSKDKPLHYKLLNSAPDPEIIEDSYGLNYTWEVEATDHIPFEVNTPVWYNPFRSVHLSTFDSWSSVVEWALPLYDLSSSVLASLRAVTSNAKTKEEEILQTIRWVQDEVRYLGLESGIGAYKPNRPIEVFLHRYGDCKDKSYLLVALLKKLGIEAWPMLVNTSDSRNLPNYLPEYKIFDHVVVCFNFEGKDYFVDPTISYQGGSIKNMHFPDYKYGLLIKKGENELTKLPQPAKEEIHVSQKFSFDSIGGNASMTVETTYRNAAADRYRQYFKSNTLSEIQRSYLDFYSYHFPEIEATQNLSITDERNASNIFITNESYTIYDAWEKLEDSETLSFAFYALMTEGYLQYTRSPRRKMPYYLGTPIKFTKNVIFIMPEEWPVDKTSEKIIGKGYSFIHGFDSKRNVVHANYEYNIDKEYLEPNEVRAYMDNHEKMFNFISYELTWDSFDPTNGGSNKMSLFITLITLVIGTFLSVKIYQKYDPPALETEWDQNIGGWLILPLVGLFILPFISIYQISTGGYFEPDAWIEPLVIDSKNWLLFKILIGTELVFNILVIVFSIMILILYLNRRTSLPRIFSIFLIAKSLFVLLDYLAVEAIASEFISGESEYENVKSIIISTVFAIFWVSYFNLSERVKDTFTKRYDAANL